MLRPKLEMADIFRCHGEAWRSANAGHINRVQRRVMKAIELCRTAKLGGHVERCQECEHTRVAYNSCRNRHCPKCQRQSAAAWLAAREAELLPVPYFHLVFKLPTALGRIAYQNKATVYGLLLKAAAETLTVIAADPKYLGADIGITAVLHTWGENLHHHPHAHCIVPGGGISPDGKRWVPCKPRFLPPRVLSRLCRRLVLEGLAAAFDAGQLHFFTGLSGLNDKAAFAAALAPLRRTNWVVYAKQTFAGPKQVLAYLARYTHRVAISNDRLLGVNGSHVSIRCKDSGGRKRNVMTLRTGEFIRRFLLHVLPDGFHRIRNYGLLANGHRAEKLALCRKLLDVPSTPADRTSDDDDDPDAPDDKRPPCPCCGGRMQIIESFKGPLVRRFHVRRLDTS
jgi:putative transposase/transposase-like zinc-binding protein